MNIRRRERLITDLTTAVKLHQAKCSGEGGDCLDDK